MNWSTVRHFTPDEFDSPDAPGSAAGIMDPGLITILDDMREFVGHPLIVTSGYRTPSHNTLVEGKPSSAHLTGEAADIQALSGKDKFAIIAFALSKGINRIGIGVTFVHLDVSTSLPRPCIWTY